MGSEDPIFELNLTKNHNSQKTNQLFFSFSLPVLFKQLSFKIIFCFL